MAPIGRIAAPVALMALIYFLSSRPHLSSGLGTWDTVLRKGAHMTEFGLLWWLWQRVLGPLPALAIALGYAATDEWHQTFVAGRHGSPVDWTIDAAGVGIAAALWVRTTRARARARPPAPSRS